MRVTTAMASTALAAATAVLGCGTIPAAYAVPEDAAVNGTYRATSDGQWASLNHQFHDMETVTNTWTITTTCTSLVECTGQITTDQGWSAPTRLKGNLWTVTHDVEGWERCSDGSVVPGHRQYKFYRVDASNLKGWEETLGPSGACGNNQWLFVEMPFTLVKIG